MEGSEGEVLEALGNAHGFSGARAAMGRVTDYLGVWGRVQSWRMRGVRYAESGKKVVCVAVFRYFAARTGTPGGLCGNEIQYAGA